MQSATISRFIDLWIEVIQRVRFIVIGIVLLITAISINFVINNISVNTDTANMLSAELPWRQLDLEYKRAFPETMDSVVIVIESTTPDQASDTAKILLRALPKDPYLIEDIYYPPIFSYFRRSAFLFMEEDELQDLSDQLATMQPFIGALLEDKTLRGLFTMLGNALQAIEDGEEIDLQPLLKEINRTIEDKSYSASWQRLIGTNDNNKDIYREFIIAKTYKNEDELLPGQTVLDYINNMIAKLELENEQTHIALTGNVALSYEELKSVSQANLLAIAASMVLVMIILMFGLNSIWLFFSSLTTLVLGLIATTAFAIATVGSLNLISVAFAVLYIGLGIDFIIHLSLRYREESLRNLDNLSALRLAARQMFRSLLLCALTTAIGFYSFIPTDYSGVAELGWVAGSGMFISLIYTFTLLPVLLSLRHYIPIHDRQTVRRHPLLRHLTTLPYRYHKQIVLIGLLVSIFSLLGMRYLHFDYNTLNLQDPNNESVKTYQKLIANSDTSPWFSVLLTKDRKQAEKIKADLEQLDVVEKIVWLKDLVPVNQEEKMLIIDDLNLLLGTLSVNNNPASMNSTERLKAVKALLSKLNTRTYTNTSMDRQLRQLQQNLKILISAKDDSLVSLFEQRLFAHLDDRITALAEALLADKVSQTDIPQEILRRWFKDGYYKIEIYPAKDMNNNLAMTNFVRKLQSYNDKVIGTPVINVEAGAAVIKAFKSALAYAIAAITILLLALIRNKLDAILILASVLIGGLFTFGFMLLLGMPFNFANIIGLPLLLGIGVDSGIHITNRYRRENLNGGNIFMTSTARGVFISSLTTICSIGNLAFSSHTGTASMGLLLTLGLGSMMVSTMLILPAILIWQSAKQ